MPTIDEYIADLDRKQKQTDLLKSNLSDAANANPDDAAANAKLARKLAMENDAIYGNKEFAKSLNLVNETNVPKLINDNPQTAKFLVNETNAKIAGDDINNLKQFEKSYGEIKPREFSTFKDPFSYTLGDFYNSELFHNLTNSLTRGYKKFREITGVMITDHSLAEKINKATKGDFFSNTLEKQKQRAYEANGMYYNQDAERAVFINSLQRDVEGYRSSERVEEQRAALSRTKTFGEAATYIANNPAAAVDATLESVGTYAPVAAASLVAAPLTAPSAVTSFFTTAALRRAAVTFAGSFGLEYGSVIDEAIVNNGGNPSKVDDIYKAITNKKLMEEAKEKAVKRGVTVGFFDAVTAGLAGKLLSKAKPTLSSVAPRVAGEGALQMGGGAAGEATAQYVTNEEFNPSAILLEAIGELPTAITEVPGNYKNTMEDAQRAEAVGNVIADMNQLSAASKVRARDSDTFKQWVDQVTEDNPIQNVYINSNTLKQAGLDQELAKISPEMAAKVEAASISNSDVEISISDYMTQIAPTPLGDAMINDLRAEGETMTRKEAAQFIENKAQEMQIASEQMMKQKEQDQVFIDSAKQVETNIFNQLQSTNVYSNTASKSFATYVRDIYVTKAAEMGITPTELYSMVPYGITANIPAPNVQLFSQNGEVRLETDAFKSFYGNSIFKDDAGKPVLLYHGTADDVTAFDVNHPNRKDSGWLGTGVYLTDSSDMSELYADQKARSFGPKGQNVMPLYARLENPYYATAEDKARVKAGGREGADQFTADLQAQGYDGVIYQVASDAKEIVVFNPAAVKSQFNDGTWSDQNNLLSQKKQLSSVDTPSVGVEDKNVLGFWPALRVMLNKKIDLPKKPLILTGTNNKNAQKQIDALDDILAKFPNATNSNEEWSEMIAYALGSYDIPIPPYAFIRDLNGDGSLKKLQTLTQGQIDDATHGFENAAEFRRAYISGELGVETTGKLFMWSFLSRGVSPYTQESLFIDAFDGADKWIAMAARGEFTKANFAEYEAWAKSVAPAGSGQPGAGATHNLNAFGQDFLFKMSQVGKDGKTHMQRLHDMMCDPDQTGKKIRREFATFGEGVGIDNKVVSFTLLVAGFPDVMVLDRVQIRQLWDDGKFNGVNLYDGVTEKRMVTGKDGVAKEKNVRISGSSLNNLAEGVRGILVYEAIERGLESKIIDLYTKLGRPQDASIGRYHWETWVADSQQEASHGTLGAILADAKGDDQAIANVAAKQGEYGAYEYGALYNKDETSTPWFGYETPSGNKFAFSVPAFRAFLTDIKKPATGVVPAKFKVTESGNAPWYTRPEVNQERLNERAAYWADRAGGTGEGQRAIEEAIQQQAANGERSAAKDGTLNQLPLAAATDSRTGLPLNPDGTVTLYHHTNAAAAEQIKRSGQLISAAEPDVYLTTSRETDIGYGDTVVAVRVNPDRLNIDDEFPNGRQDYRISVGQNGAFQVTVGEYKSVLEQPSRGGYNPKSLTTILTKESDYSTFLHETSHFYLDMLTRLAEMPNAPESFRNDLNTVIEWSGATPEQWAAWDAEYRSTGNMNEGMRKVHEAFAYNSEIYIATGEAPSVKMQSMFDMFVVWLRRVYKSIKEELNAIYRQEFNEDLPILTGEVRQVMDRMLASEELIIQAQEVRNMVPIYQTQEQSGMDDSTWAAYQALAQESQNAAITSLTEVSLRQMRWLSNAKSRIFKEQQKQTAEIRKEVKAQVAKEIEKQPIYSALRLIKNGEIVNDDGTVIKLEENTKLSVAGMEELYMGEGDKYALLDWSKLGYGKYGMLSNEGMHPDVLAERTGFQSGDQLVRALMGAPSLKEAVEQETDKRMLEQYSELSDPRAMEIAVERALHNEARARFVAAELRHAAKATQPVRLMLQAAKQAARRIVGNKLIRNVKVSEYSVAEMRSTKAAEKAMKEGKPEEVTKQLQNRLLNNQLASEATTAIQDIDKGIRYLKMVQTDQSRKRVGADYSDQIDQMLARFDLNNRSLKSIDEQTSLLKWMETQLANGYEPEIPLTLQNPDYRKNYKNMTVNEFRDLVDAVKEIEFMGRSEQNLLTAAKETAYKLARNEIVESINNNANGRIANSRTPTDNMGRSLQSVKKYGAAHFKVATIALVLDGGKEGPMWEYFIRTANKAGDKETQMRADATEKLSEIFQPILKEKMGGKGIYFEGIATAQDRRQGKTGSNFNKESRIAIALNMGNEGNIQRLLDGEGWTMQQVMPILNTLTKDELFAIQKIWDYFETFRPAIAAKERRIYGKEPQWVEPKSITIKSSDGETVTLRGGYYPIKYDSQASAQAESNDEKEQAKRDMAGAFTSATTRRSFTKNRAEKVVDRPLIYTLAAMYSGINDVVHDLAWHEWLIDANKLMRSNTIDSAIRNQYGPQYIQEMKTWIKDIAAGEVGSEGGVDIALNFLRQNVSAAGLAFNVVSAAMQITGFNQSIDKVGLKYIGVGVGKTMMHPIKTTKEVYAKSSFMANRGRTQLRELNELRNQIQDQSGAMKNIRLGSYFLMMQMQRVVDVPTWLGAYEKAIVQGNDEQRSRDLADQAVIDSQGSGMLKDLSRAERGGSVQKAFSVYYSYMNTYFNRMAVATMTEKSKGKLAARYLLLTLVPVALGHAIKAGLTPTGDDDEEFDAVKLSKELAQESLSYLLGSMVVIREFSDASKILFGAEKPRDYSGPAGLRAVADSYALLKQAVQLEFDDSFRKAAINVIGDFTALPSAQANRTITGIKALAEGETENPAAVVFGFKK
jgi:hypothetical protein